MTKICNTAFIILFAVNGKPVGKMMWQRKMNLTEHFDPPIDNPTDNDIEEAAKNLMKDMIQYTPDDRPTITQVVDRLSALKEQVVTIGDYEMIMNENHELERGYSDISGVVYSGQHVVTKKQVAAKRYITETENEYCVAYFENERSMLQDVVKPHENIVQSNHSSKKEYEEDGKRIVEYWLIMELCNLGDLLEYAKHRELTVKQKLSLMIQASRAVHHLHGQSPASVVHRYINPWKLLVSGKPEMPIIKLCNFKCATTAERDDWPFSMESCDGSLGFMAPEQTERDDDQNLTQLVYDHTVDIYALGLSCLMLLEAVMGYYMKVPEGKYYNAHFTYSLYMFTIRVKQHYQQVEYFV